MMAKNVRPKRPFTHATTILRVLLHLKQMMYVILYTRADATVGTKFDTGARVDEEIQPAEPVGIAKRKNARPKGAWVEWFQSTDKSSGGCRDTVPRSSARLSL
jgi:hypothetical protein